MNINNPTTFGTPNLTLSTANSSGTGGALRADDTILVYDTTLPTAVGVATAVGSASTAPRRDHSHGGIGVLDTTHAQSSAGATGTTQIPADDTIPQITEGTEFITLTHTPLSALNRLILIISVNIASSAALVTTVALFRDSVTAAIAGATFHTADANRSKRFTFVFEEVAANTSERVYKVRIGPTGPATITFNGESGARLLGGVEYSSITLLESSP